MADENDVESIQEKKNQLGLKYTLSYLIALLFSYWLSYTKSLQENEDTRKFLLPLVNLMPLVIDCGIKKIVNIYLHFKRNRQQKQSEEDLKKILNDPLLTEENKIVFQNALTETYTQKVKMNKNDLKKINNQISDLEK